LQVRSDRRTIRPYGLYGGNPGKPSSNYLNPERENQPLESKLTMTICRGEVFRHELAGAGGWGDPLERAPEAVLKDVRNELISLAAAANDYGVVIDPHTWKVDEAETRRLRADIRAARGWSEAPKVLWEDPPKLPIPAP
jgi:N-methylhydantoinase B